MTRAIESDGIPTYMGNPNLKKSGVKIKWSQEQIQEYVKCKNDPLYFVETYMKIINIDKGLVPLKLHNFQKRLFKAFLTQKRVIGRMSRQCGKSTTYCAFILHYIIFNDYKKVAILANKGDTAIELLGRVQLAYENLPKWLQHGIVEYNKKSFVLENNSAVIAAATSSSSVRGQAFNAVILDEVAFIEQWDQFYASTYPTITSGEDTKLIMISTPKGLNHFYKFWKEGTEKKNGFTVVDMKWNEVPGRDAAFKRRIISETSLEQWNQEYECEFLGSAGTLISSKRLKELSFSQPLDIVQEFQIRVMEEPQLNHRYIVSVDVSRGVGVDASAFSVIDITQKPFRQVCVMNNNKIYPHELEEVIVNIGKKYNNAYLLIENNDLGESVGRSVHTNHGYENMIFSVPNGRAGLKMTYQSFNTFPGLKTTKKTKQIGCSVLKNLIEQEELIVEDEKTILELFNFIRVKDSYEADEGSHDDLVMTLVLFAYLADSELFRDFAGDKYKHPTEFKEEEFELPTIITPDDSTVPKSKRDVWRLVEHSNDVFDNLFWLP